MVIVVIAGLILLVILLSRPPSGPTGPSPSAQVEAYLLAMDRRHKQLRKDHLSDW